VELWLTMLLFKRIRLVNLSPSACSSDIVHFGSFVRKYTTCRVVDCS
jgi:hypothetical protein